MIPVGNGALFFWGCCCCWTSVPRSLSGAGLIGHPWCKLLNSVKILITHVDLAHIQKRVTCQPLRHALTKLNCKLCCFSRGDLSMCVFPPTAIGGYLTWIVPMTIFAEGELESSPERAPAIPKMDKLIFLFSRFFFINFGQNSFGVLLNFNDVQMNVQ